MRMGYLAEWMEAIRGDSKNATLAMIRWVNLWYDCCCPRHRHHLDHTLIRPVFDRPVPALESDAWTKFIGIVENEKLQLRRRGNQVKPAEAGCSTVLTMEKFRSVIVDPLEDAAKKLNDKYRALGLTPPITNIPTIHDGPDDEGETEQEQRVFMRTLELEIRDVMDSVDLVNNDPLTDQKIVYPLQYVAWYTRADQVGEPDDKRDTLRKRFASRVRNRHGLKHFKVSGILVELIVPPDAFAPNQLVRPTIFDAANQPVFRSYCDDQGWGRTIDLEHLGDNAAETLQQSGVPEAIHPPLTCRGVRARVVGKFEAPAGESERLDEARLIACLHYDRAFVSQMEQYFGA